MNGILTIPNSPPWHYDPTAGRWLSVGEFAQEWNKHRNTIRQWCENGFMTETLGFATYQDIRGYWFIRIPLV